MTENPIVESQDISLDSQPSPDKASSSAVKQRSLSFFQHWSDPTGLVVIGLIIISVLTTGYFLFQSNQPDQDTDGSFDVTVTPTQPTTVQNTATPIVDAITPTVSPTSSLEPTTVPEATKKLATPTPKTISGVDMRFVDVHFYGQTEPNKAFTPFRVANGGSITVANEKNSSEFKLFAVLVNYGTDESKNIWVHYSVDGNEVKKGIAYLPGNMIIDELVTRDSAQPVMIPASGTHTVKIVIDPENQSNDVNLTNNTYTFTYTVK